jgi:hypothetical protein
MTIPDGAEEFLMAVSMPPARWQSVEIRVLAVRAGDMWRNLATLARLRIENPADVKLQRDLPHTGFLRCWHEVKPLLAIHDVVRDVASGALTVGEQEVTYLRDQFDTPGSLGPYGRYYYAFQEAGGVHRRICPDWPIHEMVSHGDQSQSILNHVPGGKSALDNVLRSLKKPFRDLEDLTRTVLANPLYWSLSDYSASFWAVAPIEARFERDQCSFEAGHLTLRVFASSQAMTEGASIGLIGDKPGEDPFQATAELRASAWRQEDRGLTQVIRYGLAGASQATAMLRIGDMAVETLTLVDYKSAGRNLRANVYSAFDPGFEKLRAALKQEGKAKPAAFEAAVARVLWFNGLAVDVVGGQHSVTDAVDIIAHSPRHDLILLVECTVQALNTGGKIGKFVERIGAVRRGNKHHRVLGALATPRDQLTIDPAEKKLTESTRLSVLGAAELNSLLQMALRGAPLDEVIRFIEAKAL